MPMPVKNRPKKMDAYHPSASMVTTYPSRGAAAHEGDSGSIRVPRWDKEWEKWWDRKTRFPELSPTQFRVPRYLPVPSGSGVSPRRGIYGLFRGQEQANPA